jgi:hypothetical protein
MTELRKPYTFQELFDKVSSHLLKQRRSSRHQVNGEMLCCYRGPNGLKCAVGCLIHRKYYSPKMEGNSVEGIFKTHSKSLRASGLTMKHVGILTELQLAHDEYKPKQWPKRLKEIATAYGLKAPK